MGAQEIFDGLRHEVGSAEGVGEGGFEGGSTIVALAIGEYELDGGLAGFAIEAAGFVTVLAIAVIDDGPVTFFSDDENGAKEIVAVGGGLLEKSTDGIAIVEGGIVGTGGAIQFAGVGESSGSGVAIGGEERDSAEIRFFRGAEQASEFRLGDGE